MNDTTMNGASSNHQVGFVLPSFKGYMHPDYLTDDLLHMLGSLSDNGLQIAVDPDEMFFWEDEEDALFSAGELATHMEWWGRWLEAKVKGYEALRDLGLVKIRETADLAEAITVTIDTEVISGEWCRRDGVIYTFLAGVCETGVAHSSGTKSMRTRNDRGTAKWMLQSLVENAKQLHACCD